MRPGLLNTLVPVLLFGIGLSGPALAQRPFGPPGPPGPPGPGDEMMTRFLQDRAEELGLDEETTAAIQQVIKQGRERARELDGVLEEARRVMHDLLRQDIPDRQTVMRQAEVIGELETERNKHRLETLIQIRSMLTPEQRARLMQMREEGREAVLKACAADFETLCPGAEPGPERFRCLLANRRDLSDECREAMPWRKRGGPGPWGRRFGGR